jgi:hypothetical protein
MKIFEGYSMKRNKKESNNIEIPENIKDSIIKCRLPKMDNKDVPINPCRIDNMGVGELQYIGLTKREYFAAMALQGLLANPNPNILPFSKGQRITNIAVCCSDDLIKDLEK